MKILTYNSSLGCYYLPTHISEYLYDREILKSEELRGFVRSQSRRLTLGVL